MTVTENKTNDKKIKSIAQKLEAINRIASVVLNEIESIEPRKPGNGEVMDFYEEIQHFEVELIKYALSQTQGNQRRAAKILNIKPTTLNSKLKKFNLSESYKFTENGDG